MVVITKNVEIKWNGRNRLHFESKGYGPYMHNQPFIVPVEDLMETSPIKIEVKCDVCGSITLKKYNQYIVAISEVNFDVCKNGDCQNVKREKVMMFRHGCRNASSIDGVKEKKEATNLARYGVVNPMFNEKVKLKLVASNIEKYGVPYHTQTQQWKDKIKSQSLIKYGLNHHSQLEEVKSKIKATNLARYGNVHALSNPKIKAKAMETKYLNSTQMSSKQQRLICKLMNGKLNYPHYGASLDVALVDEKIYMEYNGGGHWLSVKLGQESIDEFNNRNRNRWYSLYREGWKEIRITSLKDKLPFDEVILEMIELAKFKLKERSWIHFDIDNGIYETNVEKVKFDYGVLRGTYHLEK